MIQASSGGTPMPGKPMDPRRDDMKGNLYIGVVAAAGGAVLVASVGNILALGLQGSELAWLGIAVLTVLVGRLSVKLPLPNCRVSFADAFVFLSVMVFGGDLATMTAALDGFASSSREKGTWHKKVFNTAAMALSVNLAARVFTRLVPQNGQWGMHVTLVDLLL